MLTEIHALLIEIRDLLKAGVAVGAKGQQPAASPSGDDGQLHPKTLEAMERHAPPMEDAEMEEVLRRHWARNTVHRNVQCYANVLPGDNFEQQLKKAQRHFYWLKRAKRIDYDYKFKCNKRIGD